ncbi:MAG: transfer complex protein, partial [Halobacteriaceae archaeon]
MIRDIITAPLRYLNENKTTKSKSTVSTNEESGGSVRQAHPSIQEIQEIDNTHQAIVSPDGIETFTDTVRTGDTWRQTQWVSVFPNKPVNGFLRQLYSAPETRNTDISIHLVPRDTHTTLEKLEKKISDLQSDYETLSEKHRASARGVAKELSDYQEMYDTLRNTATTVFDGSLYLSTVTDSRSDLQDTGVSAVAKRSPANLTTVKPRWRQESAVQSGSPIGDDTLHTELSTKTPMLSGAVSAMFPFLSGAFTEQGIEYGTYALNESPVLVDRFNRETGY